MEKLVKPYDKECMKMAMLKHEETFREQVYELHRLYQIQKMLMKNIPRGQNQDKWNSNNVHQKPHHQNNFDLERPAIREILNDENGGLEIEDESEIELTLGPTSYNWRRKAETSLNSDSMPSFSSSSTGSSHIKRIERGREKVNTTRRWGIVEVPAGSNPNFLSGRNNSSNIEEQLRQDRLNQPPWLYQVLNLNMT